MLRATQVTCRTDTGRQRRDNEDSAFARAPLFVVADGMGGAQAGEVASRTRSANRSSGRGSSPSACSKASMAIREATSPACAPPIPSATTNTGALTNALSSFSRRWRPVSVRQTVSVTWSRCAGVIAGTRTRSRRS